MKERIVLAIILISGYSSYAQSWGDSSLVDENVFYSAEEGPKYTGGSKALYKFISENIKYPKETKSVFSNKVVNAVLLIDKEGNIAYAKIEKGVNTYYNIAAIEMIKKMPRWIPAKQNGRPVKYYQSLPIVFIDDK